MSKTFYRILCLILVIYISYIQSISNGYEYHLDKLGASMDTLLQTCTTSKFIENELEVYK